MPVDTLAGGQPSTLRKGSRLSKFKVSVTPLLVDAHFNIIKILDILSAKKVSVTPNGMYSLQQERTFVVKKTTLFQSPLC